jgi:hypothetical protein
MLEKIRLIFHMINMIPEIKTVYFFIAAFIFYHFLFFFLCDRHYKDENPQIPSIVQGSPPDRIGINTFVAAIYFFVLVQSILSIDQNLCDDGGLRDLDFINNIRPQPQPTVGEEAPPTPEVPGPPEPSIPVLPHPLISDDIRGHQLYNRLSVHAAFRPDYTLRTIVDIIDTQMAIETRIEAGLVTYGLNEHYVNGTRDQIRGIIFYPRGTPLSLQTYRAHLGDINTHGTLLSLPFRRVSSAILNYDIILRYQEN